MKGKDIILLAGVGGLALFLLKGKLIGEDGGSSPQFIPLPAASSLDLGGLFEGLGSLLGGVTGGQIIPEINIPEFKFPDVTIPEFNFPDWEKFIPSMPDVLPDLPAIPKKLDLFGFLPDTLKVKPIPDINFAFPRLTFGRNGEGLSDYVTGWQDENPVAEFIIDRFFTPETAQLSSTALKVLGRTNEIEQEDDKVGQGFPLQQVVETVFPPAAFFNRLFGWGN